HASFSVERKKLTLCAIHRPEIERTLAEAFISNRIGEPLVKSCGCHCTLGGPLRLAQFPATQAIPTNKRSCRQFRTKRIARFFRMKPMYQIVIRISLYGKKLVCAGLC